MKVFEISIGEHSARLTGYVQDTSRELPALNRCPAILILPGGAYSYCSDREAEPVAVAYMQAGFNAFVLRYTTSNKVPVDQVVRGAVAESEAALTYLRGHADELHIDPDKIAVIGFSAGGHVAAVLGTAGNVRPNVMVLGYANLRDYTHGDKNHEGKPYSILDKISADTPPAFLFATQGDTLVPAVNSLLFAQKLAECKVPYEVHIFAYGDHGASIGTRVLERPDSPANIEVGSWVGMSVTFMNHIFNKDALVPKKEEVTRFCLDMKIRRLMENAESRKIVQVYLPQLVQMYDSNPKCGAISVRSLQLYSNGMFRDETLAEFEKALDKLNPAQSQ